MVNAFCGTNKATRYEMRRSIAHGGESVRAMADVLAAGGSGNL
jgi:hypothetical protein